jgi:hypothetical protein
MKFLRVESKEDSKGRSFRGEIVAYACADSYWEGGENANRDLTRPVFAVFACSDAEARPFQANLQCGNKALVFSDHGYEEKGKRWEFMRSAKYTYHQQKHPEGVFVKAYLHELFRDDAAMVDPNEVKFILLPAKDWLAPEDTRVANHVLEWARRVDWKALHRPAPKDEQIETIVNTCHLWARQIAVRTKLPIPNDARFFAQALAACLHVGISSFPAGESYGWRERPFGETQDFKAEGLDLFGLSIGVATKAKHDEIAKVFAEQVEIFFEMTRD